MACLGQSVDRLAPGEDLSVFAAMALCSSRNGAAVPVFFVVPGRKAMDPLPGGFREGCKAPLREGEAVFASQEQGLGAGAVVADARTAPGRFDTQFLQGHPQARALHWNATVGMEHPWPRAQILFPERGGEHGRSVVGPFLFVHLPAGDPTAVDAVDQVEVVKHAGDRAAQIHDILGPDRSEAGSGRS